MNRPLAKPAPAAPPVRPLEALAAELAPRARLGEPAAKLVTQGQSAAALLDAVSEAGLLVDALRLLAVALPRREAVAWACAGVAAVMRPDAPAGEKAALAAAQKWVESPSEEHRRAAFAAAEAIDFGPAAAHAALAAFWSGGSISLPKLPVVPPPDHLLPTGVVNALMLAALGGDPDKAEGHYRRFLAQGRAAAEKS